MSTTVLGASAPYPSHLGVHLCTLSRRTLSFSFDSLPDAPPEGERWSSLGRRHPRPETPTRLGHHRARRGRVRPRRPQDRQGGRRPRRPPLGPDGTTTPPADSSSPPSGTAPASTACSTGTPATRRAAGSGAAARCGPWPGAPSSARSCSRGSGPWPSSRRSGALWELGLPVPYPVQLSDREMLMEFIGEPAARPRRGSPRPAPSPPCWPSCSSSCGPRMLGARASAGGRTVTCSPYNVLLHEERLVLIDWPQIVDIIGNPRGFEFLERDVANMCRWFAQRGLDGRRGRAARRPRRGGDVAVVAGHTAYLRLGSGHGHADPPHRAWRGARRGTRPGGSSRARGLWCRRRHHAVRQARDSRAGPATSPAGDWPCRAGATRRRPWWSCCTARAGTPSTAFGPVRLQDHVPARRWPSPRSMAATATGTPAGPASTRARWSSRTSCPLLRDETGYAGHVAFLGWSMGGYGSLLLASELGPGEGLRGGRGERCAVDGPRGSARPARSTTGRTSRPMTCSSATRCWPRSRCGWTAGAPTRSWRQHGVRQGAALGGAHPRQGRPHRGVLDAATAAAQLEWVPRGWPTHADRRPPSVDGDASADRHDVVGPDHVHAAVADPGAAVRGGVAGDVARSRGPRCRR